MTFDVCLRAGFALALTVLLAACSTARNDGTTVSKTVEINVRTTPESARCVMERSGQPIATIETAPQTVSIDRGIPNINMTCDLDGHISTFETIRSRYVGGPVNNYGGGGLLGSLVVLAIVAGTPANYDYPSYVDVQMEPNVFPDAPSREARYATLRQEVITRHDARVVNSRQQCNQNAELCRTAERESEKLRDAELAKLDEFKNKALIQPLNAAPEKGPAPAKKPG
jgi:hypothetical protein